MPRHTPDKRTRRLTLSALLLAVMLVLGAVEAQIPLNTTIPGIKLGLSNSVLIYAVYMLDLPTAWVLMLLKVVLSGLLFAPSAIPYALAGGVLSLAVMSVFSRMKGFHTVAVSMAGGAFHNIGQVAAAMVILHNSRLVYYMGVLILVGLACGALTGISADLVRKHLKHLGHIQ